MPLVRRGIGVSAVGRVLGWVLDGPAAPLLVIATVMAIVAATIAPIVAIASILT